MDWWRFLMKKIAVYLILMICLTFVLTGCKKDNNQESSEGLTIEEDMIYEDEVNEKDSGKSYDKDGDGFVDGWY